MNKWRRINMLYCFLTAAVVTGCASTQVSLETDFPSPLVEKQSTPIALIISKSLTDFVHTETVEKGGGGGGVVLPYPEIALVAFLRKSHIA